MEDRINPGPYLAPILNRPVKALQKKRITQAIAETWGIPEDKVLCGVDLIDKVHKSPYSLKGERVKIPGERHIPYVNARKFYFYVMVEVKKYRWKELTTLTGRKIAAMKYYVKKAKEHMNLEKQYMIKAQMVLESIARNEIIFPEIIKTYDAHAEVVDRRPVRSDSPSVPLSGQSS